MKSHASNFFFLKIYIVLKELRKGPLQSTPWINCLERDSRITVKSFYFHKTGKAKTRFFRIYFSDFHHILLVRLVSGTENRFVIYLDDMHQGVYSACWTYI